MGEWIWKWQKTNNFIHKLVFITVNNKLHNTNTFKSRDMSDKIYIVRSLKTSFTLRHYGFKTILFTIFKKFNEQSLNGNRTANIVNNVKLFFNCSKIKPS